MSREIKFRGQRVDNKEWVYGGVSIFENEATIYDCNCVVNSAYDVCVDTVGQFTGLKDMNEKEIYEGDIVVFHAKTCGILHKGYCKDPFRKGQIFYVQCLKSGWALTDIKAKDATMPNQTCHVHNYEFWNNQRSFEVIGNIHQNLDLLK